MSSARADEPDYIRLNRANWDDRAVAHVEGGGYDLSLWDDPAHLSQVVRFDRPRLGNITGLDVVHLQCHIGTDTLSLARLAAARVTGVDFSPDALERAAALTKRAGIANADWVLSDVYNAPAAVGRRVTSCTPASARSAGCRASTDGRASSPTS